MTPLAAVLYSFLFGLLHGIVPDEHTWPITFSYAIGGASGKEGLKAGFFFSAAFTIQRALIAELSYLALAPFLLLPIVSGLVYIVVGIAMSAAGAFVLRQNRYLHLHMLGHHHDRARDMETTGQVFARGHIEPEHPVSVPPMRWTLVHGFIAGFGFGGFSLFVNTVAAPAMASAWLGFLPGLVFGLGTMVVLAVLGSLFGASLRWTHVLSEQEIKLIGAQTGGRTLFLGGLLFGAAGLASLLGWQRYLPIDMGYALIALFVIAVVVPVLIYSVRQVVAAREQPASC